MVVDLDLRIPGKELKSKKEVDIPYLFLFVFVALFIISSFIIIAVSTSRITLHNINIKELQKETALLNGRIAQMDKELNRISSLTGNVEDKIDFLLDDLFSLEILTYLASATPDNLSVEKLKITNTQLVIQGESQKEEPVLSLAKKISSLSFVDKVELPEITLIENQIYAYSLKCKLFSILESDRKKDVVNILSNTSSGTEGELY